ncbi:MAG: L(+)-tartrate dehydratase subunit beta [Christensenellaceae bacterium]|nr:L(+)-tartrate dehydratase subunit beta [Christensenellaceae bacterium]
MKTWKLTTPVSADDIKDIRIGDVVYLTGRVVTGRDITHRRVVELGQELPTDIKDCAVFHAGPITKQNEDGSYMMVSIGPTTSSRMEKFEKPFVEKTGVRLIIGKGGMGKNTEEACKQFKALHLVLPAGNAVHAAIKFKRIVDVQWKDAGMPEALWISDVEDLGPLVVSIDTEGNNLFEQNKIEFNKRKDEELARISKELNFIK